MIQAQKSTQRLQASFITQWSGVTLCDWRLRLCGLENKISSPCCRFISSDHSRYKSIFSNGSAQGRKQDVKEALEE